MSIQSIVRGSMTLAFSLTVAGSAFAQDGGYRDMLARAPAAHSAQTAALATGYRGAVARAEAAPEATTVANAPAPGYRDAFVRHAVPTALSDMRVARR